MRKTRHVSSLIKQLNCCNYLIAVFACLSLPLSAFGQPQPRDGVEITVAGKSLRGIDFVLECGLLRNDVPLDLQIGVRNILDTTLSLGVVASSDLSVSWTANNNGRLTRDLDRNQQRWLTVSLHPTGSDPVPIIRLYEGKTLVATLSFAFVLVDYRIPVQQGGPFEGMYPSALGVNLCFGHPPHGYRLDCSSIRMNGLVPPESKGTCGPGLTCFGNGDCNKSMEQHHVFCLGIRADPGPGIIH